MASDREYYGSESGGFAFISGGDMINMMSQRGEGCQLYGHIVVQKVPGNFHISIHGKGLGMTLLMNPSEAKLSAGHDIHHLSFSSPEGPYPSLNSNLGAALPLTDLKATEAGYNFEYFLRASSAIYESVFSTTSFYELSANSNKIPASAQGMTAIPAVYFRYDFDAISINYKTVSPTFIRFLTSTFAIVGGFFAVSTLIDRIIYAILSKDVRKRC